MKYGENTVFSLAQVVNVSQAFLRDVFLQTKNYLI